MEKIKNIALVAHDNRKKDLVEWVKWNCQTLLQHHLICFIIFFRDPMQPHPHDVDVKALLRIAVVYNIPIACKRSSADFMISSPLMNESYDPALKDYSEYITRELL
jgi:methylglyoxal synthase